MYTVPAVAEPKILIVDTDPGVDDALALYVRTCGYTPSV